MPQALKEPEQQDRPRCAVILMASRIQRFPDTRPPGTSFYFRQDGDCLEKVLRSRSVEQLGQRRFPYAEGDTHSPGRIASADDDPLAPECPDRAASQRPRRASAAVRLLYLLPSATLQMPPCQETRHQVTRRVRAGLLGIAWDRCRTPAVPGHAAAPNRGKSGAVWQLPPRRPRPQAAGSLGTAPLPPAGSPRPP